MSTENNNDISGTAKSNLIKLIEDAFDYAHDKIPGYGGYLYENSKELISDMEPDLDDFISKHCH